MIPLIEAVMLLAGLAAAPDEALLRPRGGIQEEALADLDRRLGGSAEGGEKKESRQQEDPNPQRPQTPVPAPQVDEGSSFIDFDWLELNTHIGMAIFSKKFHIDPSVCLGVEARAPILWLAPSDNPDGDYLGAFTELTVAIIKRTIEPEVDKPSGAMIALTVGLDYTIIRNSTWLVLVKAGFQYATYGGVTDLEDGIAPMAGLTAGVTVSRSVSITLSPEYVRGRKGDSIMMGFVGVTFDF
jgi:hypothetical protein